MSPNASFAGISALKNLFTSTLESRSFSNWPKKDSIECQILTLLIPHIEKNFIDIGSRDGEFAAWLVERGMAGTVIEPVSVYKDRLESISRSANLRLLTCSVSDHQGQQKLWLECNADGDLKKVLDHSPKSMGKNRNHIELTVDCKSLEQLEIENSLPPMSGIIRVNCEEDDIRVLHGMGRVRSDVLLCRYHHPMNSEKGPQCRTERLVALARMLDYQHCVAVRQKGRAQLVTINPLGFVEGEAGSLIFLSGKAFENSKQALSRYMEHRDRDLFSELNDQISRWQN